MVIFWRIVSFFVLLVCAVVFATIWAKLLAATLGVGGFVFLVLVPLPVLGGIFLLAYWIDRRLARIARHKLHDRNVYGGEHGPN